MNWNNETKERLAKDLNIKSDEDLEMTVLKNKFGLTLIQLLPEAPAKTKLDMCVNSFKSPNLYAWLQQQVVEVNMRQCLQNARFFLVKFRKVLLCS